MCKASMPTSTPIPTPSRRNDTAVTTPTGPLILGIDPGSIKTGWGLIRKQDSSLRHVDNGLVMPPRDMAFRDRVAFIFSGICEVIDRFSPNCVSLEEAFMAKNAQSALKLGHIRGAVIAAAVLRNVPVIEYSATRVKQSVTGNGRAEKFQIQQMVRVILGLPELPQEDAADALANAIAHAFTL